MSPFRSAAKPTPVRDPSAGNNPSSHILCVLIPPISGQSHRHRQVDPREPAPAQFRAARVPIYRYKIAPAEHAPGIQLLNYVPCPVWLTVPLDEHVIGVVRGPESDALEVVRGQGAHDVVLFQEVGSVEVGPS